MNFKESEIVIWIYNKIKGFSKKINGSKNHIETSNAIFNRSAFKIEGDHNHILVGSGSRLYNTSIVIKGNYHKVIVGNNCIIKNSVLWVEDDKCEISIGDETTIEGAHIAVTEPNSSIKLGKDCMLSSGIDIRNGDSHSIIDLKTSKRINYAKDISIGDHVWIGAYVQILKGVNIGSNSVIGIRSLVTNDVPENSIAAGSPAKVVKENITWDRRRIYEE